MKSLYAATLALMFLGTMMSQAFAYNNTSDYWLCNNRVGGSWTFGRAPYACDVSAFGDDGYVYDYMTPAIFDDNTSSESVERDRYMSALYPVVREVADYYIRLRKPTVSAAEAEAWHHAVYAIAHQESFWSHYRKASDNRLKMMRGDYGHGHGIMQVDDRWHFVAINEGKGWSLTDNIIYSLEEYYSGWQNAPSSGCLSSSDNWRNRARAAYSAYNGGPSKICRWTNPNDTWARNDEGFASKYDSQSWLGYVSDTGADPQVDVDCLIQGNEACFNEEPGKDWADKLILVDDGKACVLKNEELICVSDQRDAVCLHSDVSYKEGDTVSAAANEITEYSVKMLDRHSCPVANLHGVGEFIQVNKSINMRATPGGTKVSVAPVGTTYQVLDFDVRDASAFKRYYLVRHQGIEGYVYAGDQANHADWATSAQPLEEAKILATSGDWVSIVPSALNMRATPGGAKITSIPQETVVQIIDITVLQDTNNIYSLVKYGNEYGYIYSGQIFPENSLSNWLVRIPDYLPPARTGRGADKLWWVWLKTCASSSCSNANTYFIGKRLEDYCAGGRCYWTTDTFEEIETQGSWVNIKVDRNGGTGWVLESNVKWE